MTSGDATSGDATSGDATSGDVISGDATSDDATSGDVISGDVTIPIDPPQILSGWCFYTTNVDSTTEGSMYARRLSTSS